MGSISDCISCSPPLTAESHLLGTIISFFEGKKYNFGTTHSLVLPALGKPEALLCIWGLELPQTWLETTESLGSFGHFSFKETETHSTPHEMGLPSAI